MIESSPRKETVLQDEALRTRVSEFVVAMIQAFLRTGYYTPSHPESRRAKSDLHRKFSSLSRDLRTVCFLVKSTDGTRIAHVEGVLDAAFTLDEIMTRGMADLYNDKLVSFLGRKEILSLSVYKDMPPEAFSKLVDLLSDPGFGDMRSRKAKDDFLDALKVNGIFRISLVFNEDLIITDRDIPWRSTLALSRLRKDIRSIPLYRDLPSEKLVAVKRELLSDVLRPLTEPGLVYAVLMNIDFASEERRGEEEGEDGVLDLVRDEILLGVTDLFIQDASRRKPVYRDQLPAAKFERVLVKLSRHLARTGGAGAWRRIDEMFRAGLLDSGSLAPEVRRAVLAIQVADGITREPEGFLSRLGADPRSRQAQVLVGHLDLVLASLLARGYYRELATTVEEMINWCRDPQRPEAVWRSLANLPQSGILEEASRVFMSEPKESRGVLARFFFLLGQWSIPPLISVLRQADELWTAKEVAEITLQVHATGSEALTAELETDLVPSSVMAVLFRVLSGIRDPSLRARVREAARRRSRDPSVEVRREAVGALRHLDPRSHSDLFVEAIEDPDPGTRKNAMRGLALSGDPDAWETLLGLIEKLEGSPHREDADLAVTALTALGQYYATCPDRNSDVRQWAIQRADRIYPHGALKKMIRRYQRPPAAFLAELGWLLIHIGAATAEEFIRRMSEDKDPVVRDQAAILLKHMAA